MPSPSTRIAVLSALLCAVWYSHARAQPSSRPGSFAIRNARIVAVSAPAIDNGTIVIEDGLITAVGADVSVPGHAWIIEGEGLTVYPGLIDAMSSIGLPASKPNEGEGKLSRGPRDRPASEPWRSGAELFQPSDERIEKWRNAGFTSAAVTPREGMLPGQTSIVNLGGERVGEMVVEPRAALATRLPDRREGYRGYPTSLLGRIAYIKQVFLDAQHYRQALNVYAENPSGLRRPEYDRTLEPIAEAIAARRPTLYPANSAVQLRRGIGMKKWIPTRLILYGAHQAYDAADDLAAAGVDVLVNVKWPEPPKDPDPEAEISLRDLRLRDRAPSSPAKLAEAGVRFAFYAEDAEDAAEPSDILKGVSAAIDNGLSTHDAVRALTLAAAEIFGVDDRLGSLDAGKIANLLITSGDLFDKEVVTKIVFIDGRKYDVPPKPPSKPAAAETQEPPQ